MMRRRKVIDVEGNLEKQKERMKGKNTSYSGDYVEIPIGIDAYKKYRLRSFLLISLIAVPHIGAGFINNRGMLESLTAIIYVAALFSIMYFGLVFFQLPKRKDKFRFGEVRLLFDRVENSSKLLAAAMGITLLAEIYFLFSDSSIEQLTPEYIFLSLIGVELLLANYLVIVQMRIKKKIIN